MSTKFKTKQIMLGKSPVFIVGLNPGKQRKGHETGVVWEGNRSGDYLTDVLERYEVVNVYLTNICNYQKPDEEKSLEGVVDLVRDVERLRPRKIIALGDYVYAVLSKNCPVNLVKVLHPSYVLRFNRDRSEYEKQLIKEITT